MQEYFTIKTGVNPPPSASRRSPEIQAFLDGLAGLPLIVESKLLGDWFCFEFNDTDILTKCRTALAPHAWNISLQKDEPVNIQSKRDGKQLWVRAVRYLPKSYNRHDLREEDCQEEKTRVEQKK